MKHGLPTLSLDIIDADHGHRVADMEAVDVSSVAKSMLPALREMPQIPCPVTEHFGPGIYIREIFIPADTFAIGYHHKVGSLNYLVKGSMRVVTPDGDSRIIDAPLIFESGPGRKVVYAITDVVFQNIFATTERNFAKLAAELIEDSEEYIAAQDAQRQITILADAAIKERIE